MVGVGLARGPVHRYGVGVVFCAVLLALLTACGGHAESPRGPRTVAGGDPDLARALSFRYERIGRYGQMDQVLAITSDAPVPMTITARLSALDAHGQPVSGVTVSSVYGTEDGRQVLMPGRNLDVMIFGGSGAAKVRGVDVSAVRAERAKGVEVARAPGSAPVSARVVNAAGFDIATRFAGNGIEVENASGAALRAQVVAIIWSRPGKGESQQAVQVLRVGAPVSVPAHGSVAVRPTAAVAAVIEKFGMTNAESVKAYVAG